MRDIWRRWTNGLFAPGLKDYPMEVRQENLKSLFLLGWLGEGLSLVGLLIQYRGGNPENYGRALALSLYFLILLAAYGIYRREWLSHATAWLYGWVAGALVLITVLATQFGLDYPAFFLPMAIVVLPPLICDMPLRVWGLILTISALYLSLNAGQKAQPLLERDAFHVLLSVLASCVLVYRSVSIRLRSRTAWKEATLSAEHDQLTGILNRRGGEQLISACLGNGAGGSFILLDVDNFKQINDQYGHGRGDEVLRSLAQVLRAHFRESDIVMRMGGDEFIVYVPRLADMKRVESKLSELKEAVHGIVIDGKTGAHLTVSMGCLINQGSYSSYDDLYAGADRLLYQTKQRSKDGFTVSAAAYRPG